GEHRPVQVGGHQPPVLEGTVPAVPVPGPGAHDPQRPGAGSEGRDARVVLEAAQEAHAALARVHDDLADAAADTGHGGSLDESEAGDRLAVGPDVRGPEE